MLNPLDWSDSDEEVFYAADAGDADEMAGNGDDDVDVNLALAAANDANLKILADAGVAQAAGIVPPLAPLQQPPLPQPPPLAPVVQPQVPGGQPPGGQCEPCLWF